MQEFGCESVTVLFDVAFDHGSARLVIRHTYFRVYYMRIYYTRTPLL